MGHHSSKRWTVAVDSLTCNGENRLVVKWTVGLKRNTLADLRMQLPPQDCLNSMSLVNRKATQIPNGNEITWELSFGSGPDKMARSPRVRTSRWSLSTSPTR